jgi:hypothetical protein
MLIERLGTPYQGVFTVDLGGVVIDFALADIDGRRSMLGRLDDGHPKRRAVEWQVKAMPRHYQIIDLAETSPTPVGDVVIHLAAATGAPVVAVVNPHTEAALNNGWSRDDLLGTGEGGDFGVGGGRSPRTGLTGAEMALCPPPAGWVGDGSSWPWEASSFQAPGVGWLPPGLPPRAHAVTQPPQVEDVVRPEVVQDAPPRDDAPPAPPTALAAQPSATATDDGAHPSDASILASYGTTEQVEKATAAILAAYQEGAALPTRQKALHRLRGLGLLAPNPVQYDALCRAAMALNQE